MRGEREGLVGALIESDRRYFELTAKVEPFPGASLAWMPGLEGVPAGCVAHRIDPGRLGREPDRWVGELQRRLEEIGSLRPRIYLDGPAPVLEAALKHHGFQWRDEIAYLAREPIAVSRSGVALHPIRTESDWEVKLALHAACDVGSDGYRTTAADWLELERRKCEGGGMTAYLVEADGDLCATLATMEVGELMRIKNVLVHPARRRERIAAQALSLVSEMAQSRGKGAVGIFGIAGQPGDALYRQIGMVPLATQREWIIVGGSGTS